MPMIAETGVIRNVLLTQLVPQEFNIRGSLEKLRNIGTHWEQFKESIRVNGVLKAPVVYEIADRVGFLGLIDGTQRVTGATAAGLKSINVNVIQLPKDPKAAVARIMELQYILNEHRFQQSPKQRMQHMLKYVAKNPEVTQSEMANRFNISQSTVSQDLRIRNESPLIAAAIVNDDVSVDVGLHLAMLPTHESQDLWLQKWGVIDQNNEDDVEKFKLACKNTAAEIKRELGKLRGEVEHPVKPRAAKEILSIWLSELQHSPSDPRFLGYQHVVHLDATSLALETADKELKELKQKQASANRLREKAEKEEKSAQELRDKRERNERERLASAPAEITV